MGEKSKPEDIPEITPEMIEAGERCLNALLEAALPSQEAAVLYIPGGMGSCGLSGRASGAKSPASGLRPNIFCQIIVAKIVANHQSVCISSAIRCNVFKVGCANANFPSRLV